MSENAGAGRGEQTFDAGQEPGVEQVSAEEAQLLAQMREQLGSLTTGDVVAEAAIPLVTLAYVRLGIPPEEHERFRDLDAARVLIDALGGLLDAVAGRLGQVERELREALSSLRLAYVQVTEHAAGARGAAPGAAPQAPPQEEGLARPPSGLWVPGQD